MAKRLLPTGTCWCGCGAQTDLGSFFAPGHDKRAEGRVIMEVFGGVPQFLSAFGYGPNGSAASSAGGMDVALGVLRYAQGRSTVAVEYTDPENPFGPLKRTDRSIHPVPTDLAEASVLFTKNVGGPSWAQFGVPFVDLVALYQDTCPVVRVAGVTARSC
jgi:hypothetical protein